MTGRNKTERTKAESGVKIIFWGFVFLILSFPITFLDKYDVNIFPGWLGFLFCWLGLRKLNQTQPYMRYIKMLALTLTAVALAKWIIEIFKGDEFFGDWRLWFNLTDIAFRVVMLHILEKTADEYESEREISLHIMKNVLPLVIAMQYFLPWMMELYSGIASAIMKLVMSLSVGVTNIITLIIISRLRHDIHKTGKTATRESGTAAVETAAELQA